MRVTTRIVLDMNRPLPWGRFAVIDRVWHDYVGPVELEKKGRESQGKVTDAALANSKTDQATREAAKNNVTAGAGALENNGTGLSQYGTAQLGSDLRSINNTYGNMKAAGLRGINQRGMGSSPTGALSSMNNTLDLGEGMANTGAYENAQKEALGENLAGLGLENGLISQYDPNRALGTASDSAYKQSQMGSTLGDVMGGLSTAAQIGLKAGGVGGFGKG